MANKIVLSGNLTKNPELRETQSGKQVTNFSLAVKRPHSEETDFFNIAVWGNQAENCFKYLKKGSKVLVIGQLQNRSYEAKDGSKRTITEIHSESVEFLSWKKDETTQIEMTEDISDLPF